MQDNENITTMGYEDDILLPEGWTEGDDPFDPDSWGQGQGADAPEGQPNQQQEDKPPEAGEEAAPAPTTGQGEEEGDGGAAAPEAPATEPKGEAAPRKLQFKARVDRQDREVELEESELPGLYQRAQITERAQAREAQTAGRLTALEETARRAGFDSIDSLLESVTKTRQEAEIKRLVTEGVHEDVAKDMAARKYAQPQGQPRTGQQPPAAAAAARRDFKAEAAALLAARPELLGKKLPDQVVQACGKGKPLMAAWYEYEAAQAKQEAERLCRENDIMRQNAANAARAPVKGSTGGGAADTRPEDDFLRGFMRGYDSGY